MTKEKGTDDKSDGFLGPEQQRDILAVLLVALAVFVSLSLVPPSVLGERGVEWFPSGNAMGVMGGTVRALLVTAIGGGAVLLPLLLLLGGLRVGEWGDTSLTGRLTVLTAGLVLLVPVGLQVLVALGLADAASSGWLGRTLGEPLVSATSWLGSGLILVALLVVLLVLTLRWNPILAAAHGVVRGGELAGRGLRSVARRVGDVREDGPRPTEEPEPTAGEPVSPRSEEPPAREASEESEVPEPVTGRPDPAAGPDDLLPDPAEGRSHDQDELPPLDLLTVEEGVDREGMDRELDRLGEILVEKLRTFNVESELGGRTTGPVVTQFEVIPAAGVKVNRIANLDADLALAMKAQSIRIVAPIPGKGAVGVEIPNPQSEIVDLREILQSDAFQRARGRLPLALGKDLMGRPYVTDLAKMPHLLIAGATGSGKSVCLNTLVTSLVYRHTPETLRLLMIDPKMVELSTYADMPHLRHPVVTDPQDAAGVLRWAVLEMERRYQLLGENGVRSVGEFNQRVRDDVTLYWPETMAGGSGEEGEEEPAVYDEGVLPHVVVVVDELADLMMTVQSEVEKPLTQLAQKARAIGVHLIVATQRPSVNVITGLIKANFPTRIAFRVASKTDSRTILDQNGAEALLGNGDMLFLPPGQSEPVRIQGAFISTEDTDRLIAWYRAQEAHRLEAEEEARLEPAEEPDILEELKAHEMEEATAVVEEVLEERDELFRAAAEVCIQQDQGSTSLLQRKLRVGYGRAARIVDQLHDAGIVGPPDGTKPREVLVGMDELDTICSAGG